MAKNSSGLIIALKTVKDVMENTPGDRNRALYTIACAALKEWKEQDDAP